jgi:hypothetical protein
VVKLCPNWIGLIPEAFAWRQLIKSLLQEGLSPDEPNLYGETPAQLVYHRLQVLRLASLPCQDREQIMIDICSEFVNSGGYLTLKTGPQHYDQTQERISLFTLDVHKSLELVSEINNRTGSPG